MSVFGSNLPRFTMPVFGSNLPLFPETPLPRIDPHPVVECGCGCGESIDRENGDDYVTLNDGTYCPVCVHTCGDCGHQTTDENDIHDARTDSRHTEPRCGNCSFECSDCNRWIAGSADHTNASDEAICGRCSENYSSCSDCGATCNGEEMHWSEDTEQSLCESCHTRASRDRTHTIHCYSHKPKARFLGDATNAMYFGIEIEVDALDEDKNCEDHESAIQSSGILEGNEWYCKDDGSLTQGFECVSHPGTWQHWNADKWEWCKKLSRFGYRSYNTDTCGMHVHVSKRSLSPLDRLKLLEFFKGNPSFISRVSRRKAGTLDRWARVDLDRRKGLIRKASGNMSGVERYTAINLLPDNTVEFRIFRGTLHVTSIKRNIGFVAALCQFVKEHSLGEMSHSVFAKWLDKNARKVLGKEAGTALREWIVPLSQGKFVSAESSDT